jgi:4-hydroxybenzoate polyprenyltransferase
MIKNYFNLLRIPHWIKNFFVFIPLLFSKHLFQTEFFVEVFIAFLAFSVTSSAVYVFNDIKDTESDRQHPQKRFRPIASGKISVKSAIFVLIFLFILLIPLTITLTTKFKIVLLIYFVLNVFYTLLLKNIVIVDIICIASGFMLRVLGGAFAIDVYVSKWLILTALFISLFLAVMKRRSELTLQDNNNDRSTRKVLAQYNIGFLDQISSTSAAGVIICYALYSVSERTLSEFHTENLVFTTLFVVFGVFRYMYLVFKKSLGENATEIILTDKPLIINLFFYTVSVIYIIYSNRL